MRLSRRLAPFVASLVTATLVTLPSAGASGSASESRLRSNPGPVSLFSRATGVPVTTEPTNASVVPGPAGARITWGADAGATGASPDSRTSAASTGGGALAPSVSSGFDTIPRIGPNWPADPTGAKSDTYVFTAVNTSYGLYDLTGTPVLGPESFDGFFPLPTSAMVFDPKVIYDQYNQMFVLAFVAESDALRKGWLLLVSIPNATATDKTTWCASQINIDRLAGDGRQWGDYPGLGYDADRVTVTTNQFNFAAPGNFAYAQVLSFPKTSLYDCAQTLTYDVFTGPKTRDPDKTQAFTIQPATSAGTAPAVDQYLLSYEWETPSLVLWRIHDTLAGLRLTKVALPIPKVQISPYGTQGGGSETKWNTLWDPGDLRLVNAFYDADLNMVYAAHVIRRNILPDTVTGGYAEAAIRWYEVQPGAVLADSTVTRYGVVGTAETDAGWPVVATDATGNLWVAYSRASAVTGEYLSAWAAEIVPGSTVPETPLLLVAGQARFEAISGPERWGDFNGISRDPVNPALIAMVNQYAKSDGSGPTQDWQETFSLLTHA